MIKQILQDKIRHEDCGKHCKTIYLLECFSQRIHIKEDILYKIEELANNEYSSEDEEKHKKTFNKYGPKDCDNFMCHAPYVLRALVERENVKESMYEEISELVDHKWYLSQKLGKEVSDWNEVITDWIKLGFAEEFRKRYPPD